MRRLTLAALALLLLAGPAWAQNGSFIRYHPPGSGAGSGDCDPAQWSSPAGLITVGGVEGACTLDVEDATLTFFAQGAGTVSATGRQGDFYLENDTKIPSLYINTDEPVTLMTTQNNFIDEDSFATDSATKAPSQQSVKAYVAAQAGGSGFLPTTFVMNEEFVSGLTTDGNVGDYNWQFSAVGSGGAVAVNTLVSTNHQGTVRLTSGATDDAGSSLFDNLHPTADITGEEWELNFILRPEDAVTDSLLSIGFTAGGHVATSSAIRAFYDTDLTHAAWIFQVCDSATTGCQSAGDATNADTVASTKAPVAGTWQRLRIRRVESGVGGNPTIYFSVGDAGAMETEKTFCASGCDEDLGNLPTVDLALSVAMINRAAATSKDLDLDAIHYVVTGQTRY